MAKYSSESAGQQCPSADSVALCPKRKGHPLPQPVHQHLNTVTPAPGLGLCGLSWFRPGLVFFLTEMSFLWLCGWYSGDKVLVM